MQFETIDYLTAVVFVSFAVGLFLLGQLFVGGGRNQPDALVRRPLVFGPLTHLFAMMLPISFEKTTALDRDLQRAGYYHRHARREYLAVRNFLVVGWLLLSAAVLNAIEPQYGTYVVIVGLIGAVLLFSLPRIGLQIQASNRLRDIQTSLPDALDMLTMTMVGGLPLHHALGRVSTEIHSTYPDLACELTIVRRHTEARSLEHALQQFSNRIDIPDVQSLTALVSQTERLGSNVAQAFRDFSDDVRRGQRQRAEAHGNRTSVAMILPIVLCLAPPIYILLLGPALLELRSFVLQENRSGGLLQPDTTGISPTGIQAGNE